jgi:hypothetical protein
LEKIAGMLFPPQGSEKAGNQQSQAQFGLAQNPTVISIRDKFLSEKA